VLGTFQKLNSELGRTIILITHEPDIAEHAERIIMIRDGLIVEDKKTHNRKIIKNI
jgi:putative ABC transport system ATP-binding protein